MTLISVIRSQSPNKKWTAIFDDGKRVSFGYKGMDDYTITKNKEQRDRYRKRHKKDLETGDPRRPGYLSYYLLWGDSPDLQTNIANYKRRFSV